jgi:hypothetical protein
MVILIFFLVCTPFAVCSAETESVLSFIGMIPDEVLEKAEMEYGRPEEVFISRDGDEWKDSIVFYYADHLYLFLYDNRVWQVRFDKRYRGEFFGLAMGDSIGKVRRRLGVPDKADDVRYIYYITDKGYPVHAALYFTDSKLTDFYLYRGDL